MRQIIYLLITTFLIYLDLSLNAQFDNNSIIGKYHRTGSLGFSANIKLLSDSTFIYNWRIGQMGGKTKGFWNLHGKKLFLNSERQPEKDKRDFSVQEMNRIADSNTTIQVKTENGKSVPFATCIGYYNGKTIEGTTDMDGKITFDINSIEKIEISFVGFKLVSFQNIDKSFNNFVFILLEEQDYYHYFTNEKWIVKKGRLYDYKIKKDKWTKNYFEKLKK